MSNVMFLGIGGFIGTMAGYLLCILMVNSSHSSRLEEMIKCPFIFAVEKCTKDCIAWDECHES